MYNLAKLLTDEPAKLERLFLLFIKLLIAFGFSLQWLDYDFSIQAFIDKPLPDKFSSVQLVFFFSVMVVVWFLFWTLLCQVVINELLIRLITWKLNKKDVFNSTLGIIRDFSKNDHFITAVEILKKLELDEEQESVEEGQSRLKQYFSITLVTFILLACSSQIDLSGTQITIGILAILNLLIGCILVHSLKIYVLENREAILRSLEPKAYGQRVRKAIEEISFFKYNYSSPEGYKSFQLKCNDETSFYPNTLKIETAFHGNQIVGQKAMSRLIKIRSENKEISLEDTILFSNIKPNEKIQKLIRGVNGLIYVYAVSDRKIFERLELVAFNVEAKSEDKRLSAADK